MSSAPSALHGAQKIRVSYNWSQLEMDERTRAFLGEDFEGYRGVFGENIVDAMFAETLKETGRKIEFIEPSAPLEKGDLQLEVQPREFRLGSLGPNFGSFSMRVRLVWLLDRRITDVLETDFKFGDYVMISGVLVAHGGYRVGMAAAAYFLDAQKSF